MTLYVIVCAEMIASIAKRERSEVYSSLIGPFHSIEEAEEARGEANKDCAGTHLILKTYR